jgi:hypothetical protein
MWLGPVPDIPARTTTKLALAGSPSALLLLFKQSNIISEGEFVRGFGLWSL